MVLMLAFFLRGDETVDLGFFSVIEHLTTCNDNGTTAILMIEVHGIIENKNKKPMMLVLHANHTHSWLDPIRFIILLSRIVGHLSDFWFTSCAHMKKVA